MARGTAPGGRIPAQRERQGPEVRPAPEAAGCPRLTRLDLSGRAGPRRPVTLALPDPRPARLWSHESCTPEKVQQWIRATVGVPGVDVEVRSVGTWWMNVTVAECLVHGRIVLCGDAVHQFPPTGGLGVNERGRVTASGSAAPPRRPAVPAPAGGRDRWRRCSRPGARLVSS
ncbi:FAD-dependent monooxygenase [Streptomyces sp. NPDC002896]|uniref:FAD-dependent monooxygenase n=1 Tax=Streptomyces sp. NPDC002896 TaxID=3154438 RepID=UPI00332EB412